MNSHRFHAIFLPTIPAIAASLLLARLTHAQTATNWIAFNDHRPTFGVTSPNVTGYDMLGGGDMGPLKDHLTGLDLPVRLVMSSTGYQDFSFNGYPAPDSPAYNLFNGLVDLGNSGIVGTAHSAGQSVTMTFTNLDPASRYNLRGTSIRGVDNADRWEVYTITGAGSFIPAHADGSATNNLITKEEFPSATLTDAQVALNSGGNSEGSLIGWSDIDPGPDGSFSVVNAQYIGPTPFGDTVTGNAPFAYALNAIMLEEIVEAPLTIVAQPAASTTVREKHPFSLSVRVRGAPPRTFQWHKAGAGPIDGANQSVYTVTSAAISDSGGYYVVVSNAFNQVTSEAALVNVSARTNPLVLLRWPATTSPFTIQHSPDLSGPWSELTEMIVDVNGQQQAAVDVTGTAQFFRMEGNPGYGEATFLSPINTEFRDRGPSLSSDGLSLYFCSDRLGHFDLWVSTRVSFASEWGAPVNLQEINTQGDEVFPALSADGLSLFFADSFSIPSSRPGNFGSADLWVSMRASLQSPWQPPVSLGPLVNSGYFDSGPSISTDGRTLLFSSADRPGHGAWDLWMTTRSDASNPAGWEVPVNMGAIINSGSSECCPHVSSDGLVLYFSSDRPSPGRPAVAAVNSIWAATRKTVSEPFGAPQSLAIFFPELHITIDPCLSADGSTLYFNSDGFLSSPAAFGNIWQAPVLQPPPLSITLIQSSSPP